MQQKVLDMEQLLQRASEDTIAAITSTLSLPPTSGLVGHSHLMAAGVAMVMAEAAHPARAASIHETEPVFTGPYRCVHELVGDKRVYPVAAPLCAP